MEESTKNSIKKCYNSWSCVLSFAIIAFVIGSIVYDMSVSKPQMRHDIQEIRENVQQLNDKFDAQQSVYFINADSTAIIF